MTGRTPRRSYTPGADLVGVMSCPFVGRCGSVHSQAAPVAAAVQADDAAVPGRREVSRGYQDLLALQPIQERLARLPGEVGVHVGARHPVRLLELERRVSGISEDERALPLRGDQ